MIDLHDYILWTGTFILILSFILALKVNNYIQTPKYMKNFYFIPLAGVVISINHFAIKIFPGYQKTFAYLFQTVTLLFILFLWRLFFIKIFVLPRDKFYINIATMLTVLIFILFTFTSKYNKPNLHIFSVLNFCQVLFCTFYYYKLFKTEPIQDIKQEPSFWITIGLLSYSCLSIPIYILNDYIRNFLPYTISRTIFAFSNILIIVMHLFFIKSYSCIIRQHKASSY